MASGRGVPNTIFMCIVIHNFKVNFENSYYFEFISEVFSYQNISELMYMGIEDHQLSLGTYTELGSIMEPE